MGVPWFASLNTTVISRSVKHMLSVPLVSSGWEPKSDLLPWHSLPKRCICGLQEAASRPCTVTMATAVPRLLKARDGEGEKGGGKGTWWLFWKSPSVSFPQEAKLEVEGGRERNGHLESRERREKKGSGMLQEQLSCLEVLPFLLVEESHCQGQRSGLALVGASVQEPRAGLKVDPVTPRLGGTVLGGAYQLQQDFFLAGRST